MTKLDILKLRAKFAELPPADLIAQFPILPHAPPGGSGPSTPADIQQYQLECLIAMLDGQQKAYVLQQHFLELLTESCYQCILLAERFYAARPEEPPISTPYEAPAPAPAPPPAPVAEPKLEHKLVHEPAIVHEPEERSPVLLPKPIAKHIKVRP